VEIDKQKIDDTVLALLYLTLDDSSRAWKSFDWSAKNRLFEKGYIYDPVNKANSVHLTEQGVVEAKRLFIELFGKTDLPTQTAPRTGADLAAVMQEFPYEED